MKKSTLFQQVKKGIFFSALGLMLAQGLVMVTAPAKAKTLAADDGSCAPKDEWVCGLNGTNYENKLLIKAATQDE